MRHAKGYRIKVAKKQKYGTNPIKEICLKNAKLVLNSEAGVDSIWIKPFVIT